MMDVKFVGLDVHKKTIQICCMTEGGSEIGNGSIPNTPEAIGKAMKDIPKDAQVFLESSSVWKATFFYIRDKLGLDVKLTNPYLNRVIAESKKKTDKVDAFTLADMGRGGYLATCHVPSEANMKNRDLVRHRQKLTQTRTAMKNSIHAILLQSHVRPKGTPFSEGWIRQVKALENYRINAFLELIDSLNLQIARMNGRIRDAVKQSPAAQIIKTIPGIGDYSALVIDSEIDDVGRFVRAAKLCAYAGMVPSVRSSGDAVHYGPITHRGSSILRWVLTECLHAHLRYAPDSDISIFYKRLAQKRGMAKAAVAAAAKMLKMIYWMLRENRAFVQNYGQELSCGKQAGG